MEVGDIKINKEGQEVEILDINRKANRVLVEFLDSYNIKETSISSWNMGILRDVFFPSVGGVGYSGNARKSDYLREYSAWKNIIYRCYVEDSDDYRFYGKEGVTVCDKWKCFEYFLEDLPHIEGYELFEKTKSDKKLKVQLDKDLKQMDKPLSERVYSLETCVFMLADDNRKMAERKEFQPHNTKTKAIGVSPDGEEFCIINIPMFAKEYNISKKSIYCAITYGESAYKGWKFSRIDGSKNKIVKDKNRDRVKIKNIETNKEYRFKTLSDTAKFIGCSRTYLGKKSKDGSCIMNGFIVERI